MRRHGCGRVFATLEEFRALPLVGYGSDAPHGRLEHRNCSCGSTLVIRVVDPPRRARGKMRGPHPGILAACALAGVPYDPELRAAELKILIRSRFAA